MTPRFYDTFKGEILDFDPIDQKKKEVKMYTCGPTVYDYAHIGNFRAFIFEDLLRRFLEFKGFQVKHVMNITDVDDKTIAGANREGKQLEEFTEKYTQAFCEDLKTLNIFSPNFPAEPPRATREIPAMIELIETLIKKNVAYVSEGSVYYRVSAFPSYGKLSKKKLEGNIKGARVDVDEYDKEEGADFALWKRAKEGEPSWDSPWGKGRPGWHIECSAMSMKYLGDTFDIHAGGEDLIFPHHENEIAQSEAATGKKFVNYWLHCKHLLVNGEKMSKSKGNFYTLRDLLAKGYDPMAIRYALLSVHYRQPLNFTLDGLKEASETIRRLDDCFALVCSPAMDLCHDSGAHCEDEATKEELDAIRQNISEALSADLNVSKALASMMEGITVINRAFTEGKLNNSANQEAVHLFFSANDRIFGLDITDSGKVPKDIFFKMRERSEIRRRIKEKDDKSLWKESDRMRDEIQVLGWLVKDGKPGELSTLKKKRRTWD